MGNKTKSFLALIVGLFWVWAIMIVFSGCGTEKKIDYQLKESARHMGKAIKLGYERKTDTVYRADTTYIKEIKHDTAFIFKPAGDTIEIIKERLKWRYITRNDSVFIEAECKADTVIKKVIELIQCDPIYIKQTPFDWLGLNTFTNRIHFIRE